MARPIHGSTRRLYSTVLAGVWLVLASMQQALALDILRLDKTADLTEAGIADGRIIRFRIRYNCASTSDSAINAIITDTLDPNFELVAVQGSAHTTDAGYDAGAGAVRFTFINPLPAGSTGEFFIQVRFKITTADQTVAWNEAVFTADNSTIEWSSRVAVTAINPPPGGGATLPPPPAFVPGLYGQKLGPSSITSMGPWLYYEVAHGNTGDTTDPLTNYSIEDPLPAGTSLAYFGTDQWSGTSQPVHVFYKTNLSGLWRPWGIGPRYHTGEARQWIYADELLLLPLEWITAVRFDYGTVPGGGDFLPGSRDRNLEIVAFMRNPSDFTPGTPITNCATISATGYTQTSCVDTQVIAAAAQPYLDLQVAGAHAGPYAIGEPFLMQAHLGVSNASSAGMDDPVIWMLLPPEVEFSGTWRMRWWAAGSVNVQPVFSKVDNFNGPNRTLLCWNWSTRPLNIPANRTWNELMVEADVRVRSRTANGDYKANAWAAWRSPVMDTGSQSYTSDTLDLDRDGNIAERLAEDTAFVSVRTGNGVAGLESTMFVRGELDAAWTKFPSVGQTVTGGRADYELHLKNIGGIVMRDTIILDILPVVGDTGVIDLSPRGSQWSPFLVDAVTAPAGVTVYYSTSRNPCRPELVGGGPPGCEDAQWTSTAPDDITTVRSLKFDLTGLEIFPGDEIILTWPMRAPWGAPTNGEVAWNSFGFVSTRADNGDALLASEPAKTGISIQKPAPPYYGDRVWMDTDKDGEQDPGEAGLNGVRVELFRDNGDNIANPATDTFVAFTATYQENGQDGMYLFGNIGPGSYFAVVLAPSDTGITLPNRTGDDKDSDGVSFIYKNRRAALMPVTRLDPLEEDRRWDQGFYTRSGIPAVWAVAQTADGRIVLGGKFAKSHGIDRRNIVRVMPGGTVDPAFQPGVGFNGPVRSLAIRGDGMIWAGGNFTSYNGSATRGVALVQPDGRAGTRPAQPDTTEINWVGVSGNLMFLAGAFGKVGGIPCGNVCRLTASGAVDTPWLRGPGANGTVYGGAVLTDGSVILVGRFSTYNGVARKGVVKVKPDGTTDTTFNPGSGASGEVYSIKLIEDGRMTLTGNFTSFAGTPCNGAIRLTRQGNVDTTMQASSLNVDSINSAH